MAYLQPAKFVFHTWSLDLAQPHFASENSEAPSSLLSEPLNRDFRNGVKLDLKFKIWWLIGGSGEVLFSFLQIDCVHWTKRKIIFSIKQKKSKFDYETGSLKEIYIFFLFGIWISDSRQMWVVVSLLSSKSECHHSTLAELPGNEDERCVEQFVSESPSFPSTGQMCHLFCHSGSWAIEAAVAMGGMGRTPACRSEGGMHA